MDRYYIDEKYPENGEPAIVTVMDSRGKKQVKQYFGFDVEMVRALAQERCTELNLAEANSAKDRTTDT